MCSQSPREHKVPRPQLALHLSVRHATFPSFTNCRASSYAATGLERWNGIFSKGRESKSCRGNKRCGKNKMSSLNICKYTSDCTQARWASFRESSASKVCSDNGFMQRYFFFTNSLLFHKHENAQYSIKVTPPSHCTLDNSTFLAVVACFLQ